jgi:uncharacterized membrane protein
MHDDEGLAKTEVQIGRVLTAGTKISTLLLAIGLACALIPSISSWAGPFLTGGLLVLLGTPMARVALSIVGFARHREWPYALFAGIVLALLVGSVVTALRAR